MLAHVERLALAVDLEHGALGTGGDEDHALGGLLAYGERARRAAVDRHHGLAGENADHVHLGGERPRGKRQKAEPQCADFHR